MHTDLPDTHVLCQLVHLWCLTQVVRKRYHACPADLQYSLLPSMHSARPLVLAHPSHLTRSLLSLSDSYKDLHKKHLKWQASAIRTTTGAPSVGPQAAAVVESAVQTSTTREHQPLTTGGTVSRKRSRKRGTRTTQFESRHERSACESSRRTRKQTARASITSAETTHCKADVHAATAIYASEACITHTSDSASDIVALQPHDSAQVESQPSSGAHGSRNSSNGSVVFTSGSTNPGSETVVLQPQPNRQRRCSHGVTSRRKGALASDVSSDSSSSCDSNKYKSSTPSASESCPDFPRLSGVTDPINTVIRQVGSSSSENSNIHDSSTPSASDSFPAFSGATDPRDLVMSQAGSSSSSHAASSSSSSSGNPVHISVPPSSGMAAAQPQPIRRKGRISKNVTKSNKVAATAHNNSSSSTDAAQAADSDRLNSVLRLIRIMQLRKQRESSGRSSTSSKDVQPTVTLAAAGSATGLQQQQQPEEEGPHAAAAAAATSRGRRVAALPADEVLMTDTSHMNPVYRRIRLQELRLRLQQQLRGPQLQQQLLQVQQQQLLCEHQQELSVQQQQPLTWHGEHTSDTARDPSATADSSSASISELQQESSSSSRGATQGLNSVQRTIRIAQLQRILQHRKNSTGIANSSASNSIAMLTAGAACNAAAAATPPGVGSVGSGNRMTSAAPNASSSRRSTAAVHSARLMSQSSTGRGLPIYQLQSQQQQQQHRQQAAVTAAVAEQQLVAQLVAAGVPAATAQALLEAADNTPAANPFSTCRAQVLDRLLQLQELLCLPSVAAAAKAMIKQPNLLARKPETLRRNLVQLSEVLQLHPAQLRQMLCRYPAALDMAPDTAAHHAAVIAKTLDVSESTAVTVICKCPRLLGLSPDTLADKLGGVQTVLDLPTLAAAVDVVQGFPTLLGLSTKTLGLKWQRLKELAALKPQWRQQLQQLQQQGRVGASGLLGRLLAAGPSVLDRLQYAVDAGAGGVGDLTNVSSSSSRGGSATMNNSRSRGWPASSAVCTSQPPLVRKRAVKPAGEQLLSTLLLQSQAGFAARYPEFVLWRLKQRSSRGYNR